MPTMPPPSFSLTDSSRKFPYFFHAHNCGRPGERRRTERTVELSVANVWLYSALDAWEIGAVSPYYWPGRIRTIVDPIDPNPLVTTRKSLFDVDFTGQDVLSISTIEHIGEVRYVGLDEKANPLQALEKIAREAQRFLLTFPVGVNALLDNLAFSGQLDAWCKVRFLIRNADETWEPAAGEAARKPYGEGANHSANSVAILERGDLL